MSQKLRFTENVEEHVKTYVTTQKDFDHNSICVICLWHPFTNIDLDEQMQENHCILGDVGRFNSRGGFDVMFNIAMTMEENRKMNYHPPRTFKPIEVLPDITFAASVAREDCPVFITKGLEYERRQWVFANQFLKNGTDFNFCLFIYSALIVIAFGVPKNPNIRDQQFL